MNIVNRTALRSLQNNRVRTLVTVVGVALSTALTTAVVLFGASLLTYMIRGAEMKYGGWHAAFWGVDAAFAKRETENEEVANVVTVTEIGYAQLKDAQNPNKPYLFVAGYTEDALQALPVTLLCGRMPENDGEVLLSGKAAAEGGAKLAMGDVTTLLLGRRVRDGQSLGQSDPYRPTAEVFAPEGEKTYTVVGVCQRPRYEEDTAPGYTLITKANAGDGAARLGAFVTLKNPRRLRAYLARAAQGRAAVLNDQVLRFMGLTEDRTFNALLYAVGGVVLAIIMTGSVFLIYNAFHISLSERTREWGMLMSVGATARQLRGSVLFEGLCVGAVAIPVGLLAGLGCAGLVTELVSRNFESILYAGVPLTPTLSAPALLGAAAVSALTILLSAYLPARKAVRVPVMALLRQTGEGGLEAKTVRVSALRRRVLGLAGTLAMKNDKRNQRRYRSTVLSLMLSVTLFVSASAFVADMNRLAGGRAEVAAYDVALTVGDMDDGEMFALFERLSAVNGVYAASCQETVLYACVARAGDLAGGYWRAVNGSAEAAGEAVSLPMRLQFLDDAAYGELLARLGLPKEAFAEAGAPILAVAQAETMGEYENLFAVSAPRVTIAPARGGRAQTVSLAVVNAAAPDILPTLNAAAPSPILLQAMLPYSRKAEDCAPDAKTESKGMTFLCRHPARAVAEMEAVLEDAGVFAGYELYNINRMMDENRNTVFIARVFSTVFIAMITLIAVANVFNTISTNIRLRRRELAMLRSVGMAERDFQKMMNFECAFYGVRALAFGLPLAVIAARVIHGVMFARDVAFVFPWIGVGLSVCGVMLIVFVTMLYATRKIKKENIIDALRDDMA